MTETWGEYHVHCLRGSSTLKWRIEVWAASSQHAIEICLRAGWLPVALSYFPTRG